MLKDLWRVLTGRLSWEQVINFRNQLNDTYRLYIGEKAVAGQLKRDMEHAKAAIAELKSQLPKDWEAQRKDESDKLGEAVINQLKGQA